MHFFETMCLFLHFDSCGPTDKKIITGAGNGMALNMHQAFTELAYISVPVTQN